MRARAIHHAAACDHDVGCLLSGIREKVRVTNTLVLIHSPLVGPATWDPVAGELCRRGIEVLTPDLTDNGGKRQPFQAQHVAAAVRAIQAAPEQTGLVLAGHSGAGPLLPVIGAAIGHQVRGYLFVDAGIPADGLSRLALMEREDPAFAGWFRAYLADGGRYPAWTDAELAPLLPDDDARALVLAGIRPRGRAFFEEPIPVPAAWPDAPCGYLQLSEAYDVPARQAAAAGWPVVRMADAGHFHLLADPGGVAKAMLALIGAFDPDGSRAGTFTS
jgi:hypothetical protein